MVRFRAGDPAHGLSVFADEAGRFRSPALPNAGPWDVRVRRIGWRDLHTSAAASDPPARLELVLQREDDPAQLAAQLPANRWYQLVLERIEDPRQREELKRQCTYCHQQGSAGHPRDARRGGVAKAARADGPHGRDALDRSARAAARALLRRLRARERGRRPHGAQARAGLRAAPAARGAARRHRRLGARRPGLDAARRDRAPGRQALFGRHEPRPALPAGSERARRRAREPGTSRAAICPSAACSRAWARRSRRPRTPTWGPTRCRSRPTAPSGSRSRSAISSRASTRRASASRWWSSSTASIPTRCASMRAGGSGTRSPPRITWACTTPPRNEQRELRLPARDLGQAMVLRMMPMLLWLGRRVDLRGAAAESDGITMPVPYGVDVAPDGSVWFSQLNEHRIGRVDPDSFAIEMIDTPFAAPRRLRFDAEGRLWIPSFSESLIARFDPKTRQLRALGAADRAARQRDPLRAARRPAQRSRLDLRHQQRHADPLRARQPALHRLSASHAGHLHARDRLRRRGPRLDLELELARLADRGRDAAGAAPGSGRRGAAPLPGLFRRAGSE